jgi:type II secretory pathway pseudopilin PulG
MLRGYRFGGKSAGFTVIETLVIAFIIGLLVAIAVPSWLAFVQQQKLNKVNDIILYALKNAQQEAKKSKRSYSVSFQVDGGVSKISIAPASTAPEWKNLGQDIGILPGEVLIYTNLDSTIANKQGTNSNIDYSAPGTGTITFDYIGSLDSSNGSVDAPLKVAVAIRSPGGSTFASNLKRCVIVDSLIGAMRTGKDSQCDG